MLVYTHPYGYKYGRYIISKIFDLINFRGKIGLVKLYNLQVIPPTITLMIEYTL